MTYANDSDEVEKSKEVYARFGLALYWAQVLEHQIVNMFVALRTAEQRPLAPGEVEDIFEKRFARTMGALIQDLKKAYQFSDKQLKDLQAALERRNWLAHRYFRERSDSWFAPGGTLVMVTELTQAADEFRLLDRELTEISFKFFDRVGLTREAVEASVDELRGKT